MPGGFGGRGIEGMILAAKYAREECGFNKVPMMCYHELATPNSLKKCLRIMLNINTNKTQDEIKHIYLKGAKILREDIK